MTKRTVPVDTLFSKRLDYILVPAYIGSDERVVGNILTLFVKYPYLG